MGIWIDKDIPAGENWDNEIKNALAGSNLLVLIVTPQILLPNEKGEDNYVHRYEFEYAKQHNIAVLPIMFEAVDMEAYNKMYDNRQAVDWKSLDYKQKLLERLEMIIVSKDKEERIRDAQRHKSKALENVYLCGAGYLHGINCEKNAELAIDMITTAAKGGVFEAAKELASMYNNGIGVEIDFNKAIEWQKKAVEISGKNYKDAPSFDSANDYFWEQIYLGDYYRNMAKLDFADEAYLTAGKFAENYYNENKTGEALRNLSGSYERLAGIKEKKGKLDEAEELYNKSSEIRENLVKDSPTIKARRDLWVSYNQLAGIKEKKGKIDEAEELYKKGLEIAEGLVKESPTIESRRDLSISYGMLAGIKEKSGKLDEAEELYNKCLKMHEDLVKDSPTIESRRDLSVSYNKLAGIKEKTGKPDEAEELYEKCLKMHEDLVKDSPTILARRDLSVSYNNLAGIKEKKGKLDEAEALYKKDLKICEDLVKGSPTIEAVDDLAISYSRIGLLKSDKEYLEKAQNIWKQLAEQTGLDSFKEKLEIVTGVIEQLDNSSTTDSAVQTRTGKTSKSLFKRFFSGLFGLLGIFLPPLGIIFGIISVCLGASAKKKSGKGKFAIALGVIGIIVSVLVIAAAVAYYFYDPAGFMNIISQK